MVVRVFQRIRVLVKQVLVATIAANRHYHAVHALVVSVRHQLHAHATHNGQVHPAISHYVLHHARCMVHAMTIIHVTVNLAIMGPCAIRQPVTIPTCAVIMAIAMAQIYVHVMSSGADPGAPIISAILQQPASTANVRRVNQGTSQYVIVPQRSGLAKIAACQYARSVAPRMVVSVRFLDNASVSMVTFHFT